MSLTSGTRLGPYEIVEQIGAGGMGEVFKGLDTRLDRHVAIKILPAHWADDADMKERFDREAQAIASLNHPHICALHDVGTAVPRRPPGSDLPESAPDGESPEPISFLVMELLEGETLAARLQRGPLDLDDALEIAVQVVDALDQAHRRGVVHRDLKPGNVMLTPGGPKLLDFGLARTPAQSGSATGSGANASGPNSITYQAVPTTPLTTPGLLIGTLQYMAPEQLEGQEADARTDIFAFGVMLHEMITGKRAFEGKSQVLLISSIATSEPEPLSSVQPETPPALEHVVRTCMAKSPDDRWQTARDLLAELRWIADGGAAATAILQAVGQQGRRVAHLRYAAAATALLVLLLAIPAFSYVTDTHAPVETRFRVWSMPDRSQPHQDGSFAISPDGRFLTFRGDLRGPSDPNALYVGTVGEVTFRRLPGTEEPTQPFWSPDGRHIAFLADGRLKRIEASGGPPAVIAQAPGMMGGAWNPDGVIIFGSANGIYSVSAEGGAPELVTAVGEGEAGHYWPHFLPDGRRFLYLAWSREPAQRAIYVASLDSDERTEVISAESNVALTAAGHLVFHRSGAVYAQALDTGSLAPVGEPARIADGVGFAAGQGRGLFEVSRDGVLVYSEGGTAATVGSGPETWLWQPALVERNGSEIARVGPYYPYRGAELSPDGTRVALHRHDDTGGDVWVIEPSGADTRITYTPERDNSMPIWSPDGKYLAFNAQSDGKWGLYRSLSDRGNAEELLYESDELIYPMSWSPDGLRIVFGKVSAEKGGDILMLPLEAVDGAVAGEPEPFIASAGNETHGQVSPDGRWLAYASNETDRSQYEIYVSPFPSGLGRWQVSRTGGDWPRWSRDGEELFFLPSINEGAVLVFGRRPLNAVKVTPVGDRFVHEPPVPILTFNQLNMGHTGGDFPTYATGPKGEFLVFIRALTSTTGGGDASPGTDTPDVNEGLTVARAWEAALEKR